MLGRRHALGPALSAGSRFHLVRARGSLALLPAALATLVLSACGGSDGGAAAGADSVVSSAGATPSNVVSSSAIPVAGIVPGKIVDSNVIPVPAPMPTKPAPVPEAAPNADWIDVLVGDMRLFHDGPSAVLASTRDWASGAGWPEATPRPAGWAHARPHTHTMADTGHANGAGHPWRVPGPYSGNQAPNTRVQQRDIQMWWLLSDGTWLLGSHDARPGNLMLAFDPAERAEKAASEAWRDESGNGGGASMRSVGREGYARHLWRAGSASSQVPENAVGAVAVFFARLILDDPGGTDDRDTAHVLSACAGDWLRSAHAVDTGEAVGQNVLRLGHGRLKYVTREWQLFGWTNLSEAQLRANPPPLIGLSK